MILGFKTKFKSGNPTHFEQKILACWDKELAKQFIPKIHTIREDKNNRWQPGKVIHFATGVRTKNYNCFKIGTCKSIQKIEMVHYKKCNCNFIKILIDDKELDRYTESNLSASDGFDSWFHFDLWFNKSFKGKLIHWTDFQYI